MVPFSWVEELEPEQGGGVSGDGDVLRVDEAVVTGEGQRCYDGCERSLREIERVQKRATNGGSGGEREEGVGTEEEEEERDSEEHALNTPDADPVFLKQYGPFFFFCGAWLITVLLHQGGADQHAADRAYRGAGRPEAIYIIERLMDAAAREIGIDPAELRRRNMIRPEQMPYTNPMGKTYDSGQFEQVIDQGAGARRLERLRRARARDAKARGKLRGRGIATFLEWTGGNVFEETRHRRRHRRRHASRSSRRRRRWARASRRRYAQLAVDVFGVPIEKIRIVQGDTDRGQRLRQRRLALAVHRRLGGARRVASARSTHAQAARRPRRSRRPPADIEYRDGALRRRRHRSSASACSSSPASQPERAHRARLDERGRRADLAERAATSARSRSIRRPARVASSLLRRSTTSAASSTR